MIFFMAGTSDARELGVMIHKQGYPIIASVVTEHAAQNLKNAGIDTHVGRLHFEDMCGMLRKIGAKLIVDASHPFAEQAHRTVIAAADACHIPFIRYERPVKQYIGNPSVTSVDTYEEAAKIAKQRKGSIMLTTGSKTLQIFTSNLLGDTNIRLVARILPCTENMEKCMQLGMEQTNIVAIQGPFTREFNRALYHHYKTSLMITKESGEPGSVDEKVEAALDLGIEVVVIARPNIPYACCYSTFEDVIKKTKEYMEGFSGGL